MSTPLSGSAACGGGGLLMVVCLVCSLAVSACQKDKMWLRGLPRIRKLSVWEFVVYIIFKNVVA